MNTILGTLIEAWEEVKINRARVILSLIGVGAAVWAMATVIALGQIAGASTTYQMSQWTGVRGTINVSTMGEDTGQYNDYGMPIDSSGNVASPDATQYHEAVLATVNQLKAPYWTTYQVFTPPVDAPQWDSCAGDADWCAGGGDAQLMAVDPQYFTIYSRTLLKGRLLQDSDADLQMNPVVINETAWNALGNTPIEAYPRLWLSKDHSTAVTVVGVIRNVGAWDQAEIYAPSTAVPYMLPNNQDATSYPELRIVAPAGEEKQASEVAASVLQANLGQGFTATGSYDEASNVQDDALTGTLTKVVAAIGAIVILLGALGLLTVSIVTIKGRVREIGIRRAVGASARRVFFSVFFESVVATTAAGFIGVILSVFTIRSPLIDLLFGADLGGLTWPYPMQAALLGVLISASVGALCGIIPATIAVKMRPIDAIRF
ncbi:MAG: ABC transporter permease [Actinomycetaceae bacterium]|nr:ABC transporter permease [Arcanobacterium sp.]MDD7504537.1 ABC transporter permease [Actinomycetaceae bacterium]MDY6143180.1 FtsX-like permease family protein [Arcanobacterium sp.]